MLVLLLSAFYYLPICFVICASSVVLFYIYLYYIINFCGVYLFVLYIINFCSSI